MWMPDPQAVSREDFHIQRVWQGCEEKELRRQPEEEEEELQAKATSGCISEVNSNLESHIKFLKGGGQPLSENDRTFFEPRLQPGAGCGNILWAHVGWIRPALFDELRIP